jgi:hypothetical protein
LELARDFAFKPINRSAKRATSARGWKSAMSPLRRSLKHAESERPRARESFYNYADVVASFPSRPNVLTSPRRVQK